MASKVELGLPSKVLSDWFAIYNREYHKNLTNRSCQSCVAQVLEGCKKLWEEYQEPQLTDYEKKCENLKKAREAKNGKKKDA